MPMVWDFFYSIVRFIHTSNIKSLCTLYLISHLFFFSLKTVVFFFSGYNLLQTIRSVQIFIDVFCIGGILEANQYVVDTEELED